MATNYFMMKESEDQLLKGFNNYFAFVIKMNNSLLANLQKEEANLLIDEAKLSDQDYQVILYDSKKSQALYDDMLDDCMWVIQKNEPRAAHLRFVISIINSIRDLQKVGDYTAIIAKFFYKRHLNKPIYDNFIEAFVKTNQLINLIYQEFTTKRIEEFREDIDKLTGEYHQYLKNKIRTCSLLYSETDLTLENKTLIDLIACFGALERSIEHLESVLRAFYYVNVN